MPLNPETSRAPKHPVEVFRPRFTRFLKTVLQTSAPRDKVDLAVSAWQTPAPVPYTTARSQTYTPVAPGFRWGPAWSTCWFRVQGTAPNAETLAGRPLDLVFSCRTEATLWSDHTGEPVPVRGLDINRDSIDLTRHLGTGAGDHVDVLIEAACNHPFGVSTFDWDTDDTRDRWSSEDPGHLRCAYLAPRDEARRTLTDTYRFASRLLDELDPASDEARALFDALTDATQRIGDRDIATTADEARAIIDAALRNTRSVGPSHLGLAVAHAHIDTAWLWPIRETRRKIIRSWTNALEVLDRNPRASFVCSQAQQYAYLEEDAPRVLDRIKERVAEGRWEPTGGMWVEPDASVPSAESLIRQALMGQRTWARLFGEHAADQTVLYLPDTFGFPASLPNIMHACGLDTFVTNKIAWNQATPYPHTNFRWRGLGGPDTPVVLAHYTPNHDYNNTNSPKELIRTRSDLRGHPADASEPHVFLHPYGFGDGGGGPTLEQADAIDRTTPGDESGPHPALPAIRHGTMREFRERLRALDNACTLPTHDGELYLELHRGTLTTHAWLKRDNRLAERDLRIAELLAFAGPSGLPDDASALADRLTGAWETLCLQQFHDILPGTSITPVYDDAREDLARVSATTSNIIESAGRSWSESRTLLENSTDPAAAAFCNPCSAPVSRVIEREGDHALVELPPISVSPFVPIPTGARVTLEVEGRSATLRNEHLEARIDDAGRITSLRAMNGASPGPELAAAPLNRLALYRDIPMNWDAWDIDAYAEHELLESNDSPAESWSVVTDHPLIAEIEITRRLGDGTSIRQTIRLDAASPYLEIDTAYRWDETHRLLRMEFPTAVDALSATYDIQAGTVERPTTRDTPETAMMFEVCAHRWMDVSGHGQGLSVLNNGRYGCGARRETTPDGARTTMHLSLLRAPTHPDPNAGTDEGSLNVALLPHPGDWRTADTDRHAEALNQPPRELLGGRDTAWSPLAIAEAPGQRLEVSAIKPAHDDPTKLVLRLIETRGVPGEASVRWSLPVASVVRTDAIERPLDAPVSHAGDTTTIPVRANEIVTLLATRA